jgi:hypothetical protein
MSSERLSLDVAKERLDVATLWRMLKLPGEPTRSCRCPFHDDRCASFSVFVGNKGALRWKCHSGCGEGGSVELLARALEIDAREACRRLLELAGSESISRPAQPARPAPRYNAPPSRRPLLLPAALHRGDRDELRAVAELRQMSLSGIELASNRGLLWFASIHGSTAWIVTDWARINAQARKLDGGLWRHIGNKKAWTLLGSRAAWPIGTKESSEAPCVVVVEGGPDLLAAHHFIISEGRQHDVVAIAMLGAANNLPEDALLLLANKRIRIYPHTDLAGKAAAIRWTGQLERVGCTVDAFRFDGLLRADGVAVNDLNDFVRIDPDCFEAERAQLEEVLPR